MASTAPKIQIRILTKHIGMSISVFPISYNRIGEFEFIGWPILFILFGNGIPVIAFLMANIFDSDIERIVNERYRWNGLNFHAAQDARIKMYTIRMVAMSALDTVPITIRPLIKLLIAYISGQCSAELWDFLCPSLYRFNIATDIRTGLLTTLQANGGFVGAYFMVICQLYFLAIKLINDKNGSIKKMNNCYFGAMITSIFQPEWCNFSSKHCCYIEMIIMRPLKPYMLPCTLKTFEVAR